MEDTAPQSLSIVVGSMTVHDVRLTCVGPDLYRLDDEALLFLGADDEETDEELENYPKVGDIMLAERIDAGTVRYIGRHARGAFRHFSFTLFQSLDESKELRDLLDRVVDIGGRWELDMGAFLMIAIPIDSDWDLQAEFLALP